MKQVLHYPNLKTVLMVEETLKKSDTVISKAELERRLPTKIMHQTLKLILEYLEESGKIYIGSKGISWIWIEDASPKLKEMIRRGVRVA